MKENILKEEQRNNLPMNWWNFCKYFRFPISIVMWIISLITICNNVIDGDFYYMDIVAILVPAIYIIFQFVVYTNFAKETKIGYKLLISSLFVELLISSALYGYSNSTDFNFTQSFIIYAAMWGLIFVYPNYVYFSKRKYVFSEDKIVLEKQYKNNMTNILLDNTQSSNNINKIENTQQSVSSSWQEYLDKNYAPTGKGTKLSEIRIDENTDTFGDNVKKINTKDKFCRHCGYSLLETDKFCANCGKKLY